MWGGGLDAVFSCAGVGSFVFQVGVYLGKELGAGPGLPTCWLGAARVSGLLAKISAHSFIRHKHGPCTFSKLDAGDPKFLLKVISVQSTHPACLVSGAQEGN